MSDTLGVGTARSRPTFLSEYAALLRVVVLVGVPVGVLAIGIGGRLAMLLLRLTSPPDVVGVTSDDGFEIGRVTLAGTYTLVNIGVAVGLLGALACLVVSPWLIGPTWFRATTVGVTAGALVGSMIFDADGVDFTRLHPLWLAVLLFLALPALVGALLLVLVDRRRLGPAAGRDRSWRLPSPWWSWLRGASRRSRSRCCSVARRSSCSAAPWPPRLTPAATGTLSCRPRGLPVIPVAAGLCRRHLVTLF